MHWVGGIQAMRQLDIFYARISAAANNQKGIYNEQNKRKRLYTTSRIPHLFDKRLNHHSLEFFEFGF
jgi:hypothetical protein